MSRANENKPPLPIEWTEEYGCKVPTCPACMMALLKIARIIYNPEHMDSWVDGCGYLACGAEIAARRASKKLEGV